MANNKSIQVLRAKEHSIIENSSEILYDGQPLYDMERNTLIIGGNPNNKDSIIKYKSPINASGLIGDNYSLQFNNDIGKFEYQELDREVFTQSNLIDGQGKNSLTLEQNAEDVVYTGSNNYLISIEGTGALQTGAVNFSQNSKVDRNNFLNVGVKNVVANTDNLDEDDGGILAGYKLYADSRGTSLFGAWNRARSSNQSLIGGYRNTAQSADHVIILGQNNYVKEQGDNATFGYTLVNRWKGALVVGHWNDPDTYSALNGESPLFVVGNGKLSQNYSWQRMLITESNAPSFPDIDSVINYNEKHKENPLGEDLFYYSDNFNFTNLVLDESKVSKDSEGRPFVFRKIYPDRSNAFIVTNNGRAILNRVQPGLGYVNLKEHDLLTKEEIEYVIENESKSINTKIQKEITRATTKENELDARIDTEKTNAESYTDTEVSKVKSYTDEKATTTLSEAKSYIADLNYTSPNEIETSAANGFIATVKQENGVISATKANKIESLIVNQTIQANTFVATSDKRLKENIIPYKCEKSILDLPVYEFDYINSGNHTIGCMAQDLREICPEIVSEDMDGYLRIEESKLVYLLLEEVKKLRSIIKRGNDE